MEKSFFTFLFASAIFLSPYQMSRLEAQTVEAKGSEAETIDELYAPLKIARIPLLRAGTDTAPAAGLPFQIKSKSRCFFGDLDALAMDSLYMANPRFILSLEPVVSAATHFTPRTAELLKPQQIAQGGVSLQLEFPFLRRPELLGVFICGDSQGQNRCNTPAKKPADFHKMFKQQHLPLLEDYTAPDQIYFFKPLLITATEVYFPTAAMTESRYALFERFASEFLKRQIHQEERKQLKSLGSSLQSVPLRELLGQVRLDLPRYEKDRCIWTTEKQ